MGRDDWRQINDQSEARFRAVEQRAFEEHVLSLVRGRAAVFENAYRELHGREPSYVVEEAQLRGTHPSTRVVLLMVDQGRGRHVEDSYAIWNPDGTPIEHDPAAVAGQIMMLARGG